MSWMLWMKALGVILACSGTSMVQWRYIDVGTACVHHRCCALKGELQHTVAWDGLRRRLGRLPVQG
jgi:hypothetical protein